MLTTTLLKSTLLGIKNTPKFIDHNLKMEDQILIILGVNIPETTGHQMTVYVPVAPSLFLHYLGKTKQAKYYIFIQCNIVI